MFILTSNLRENHQKMYNPPEGMMISDINRVRTKVSFIIDHFKPYACMALTGCKYCVIRSLEAQHTLYVK